MVIIAYTIVFLNFFGPPALPFLISFLFWTRKTKKEKHDIWLAVLNKRELKYSMLYWPYIKPQY